MEMQTTSFNSSRHFRLMSFDFDSEDDNSKKEEEYLLRKICLQQNNIMRMIRKFRINIDTRIEENKEEIK